MGSFEAEYDEAKLRQFTPEARAQLEELHRQLDVKFREIANHVARELGYNEGDARANEEADEAIGNWELDAVADAIERDTPLQHLLREHHDISEMIVNVCHDQRTRRLTRRDRENLTPESR